MYARGAMNRRAFLSMAAAGAAQGARGGRPKLAVQTYVWTQEFAASKIPLQEGMPRLFAETRAAGFTRIELMPAFFEPETSSLTAELLKKHGMEVPIVYSGARLHDVTAGSSIERVVKLARASRELGCGLMNVNPDPKPRQELKTEDELKKQARGVEQLRAELKREGMGLALHHHSPEMKDGAREWYHLLRTTKANLCIDVDWAFQGGQEAVTLLKAGGRRVVSLHVRNARQGVWTQSLDEGDYDYGAVRQTLDGLGYSGFLVVELAWNPKTERTRALKDNLERSRVWAEKMFRL